MTTELEVYMAELNRLHEEQKEVAQEYASQMLYMREGLYMRDDAVRTKCAEDAAAEWLRLEGEISALRKKYAAEKAAG